jgi:RNA polymerase sigma-70 factor (ECF subfamily)
MEQRITRAKRTLQKADVRFETPGAIQREERLRSVLAMLYLMFNEGYSTPADAAPATEPLCTESIRLARLLHAMFPNEPEVLALVGLLELHHARAAARFNERGEIMLLDEQDRSRWDRNRIAEALGLVGEAWRMHRPGPYQVQAAIAALHCRAPSDEETDWSQIARLYAALEEMNPTPVVRLNRAVAVAKSEGPQPALDLIQPLGEALDSYFHFHGTRGWLLAKLGRNEEARTAWNQAIALARHPAEAIQIRRYLDTLDVG